MSQKRETTEGGIIMPKGVYKRTQETCAKMSKAKRGVPLSPEHRAALSKAHTGVPLSPEHCDAILKGNKESDARKAYYDRMRGRTLSPEHTAAIINGHKESEADKANADAMRGGNDICKHHYIYDESDLSKYTMKMTRSAHTRLHHNMQISGIKVPYINMVEA